MAGWEEAISPELWEKYEFHNYNHAVEILSQAFFDEFEQILQALNSFSITTSDIMQAGGNETVIPKKFSELLEPRGWKEIRITGDLIVKIYPRTGPRRGRFQKEPGDIRTLENFIDGHNIDYVKNRVACDLEWNSKDQTFDRDLFALRTYYECGVISAGLIVTRSEALNQVFRELNVLQKYGASTTWMGKLLPRLEARRHGGCPILAVGIKPAAITDIG
jgi:CRISPR-associated protein Csd2